MHRMNRNRQIGAQRKRRAPRDQERLWSWVCLIIPGRSASSLRPSRRGAAESGAPDIGAWLADSPARFAQKHFARFQMSTLYVIPTEATALGRAAEGSTRSY